MKFRITPNEPCYCGSGKKYKYCCRENPKPNADFLKEYYLHWQRGQRIDAQLQQFFSELRPELAKSASDLMWENPFLEEEEIRVLLSELDETGMLSAMHTMLRLFFFGNIDTLSEYSAQQKLQDSFEEWIYGDLDPEAVEYARKIAATPFDFFQILSSDPGTCLIEVRSLSDNRTLTIIDRALSRHSTPGLLIGARAVPFQDNIFVLETPVNIAIPASRLDAVRAMLEWWHKEEFGKKPFDFARALNSNPLTGFYIAVSLYHSMRHPVLHNKSGHLMVFVNAEFKAGNPKALREFLMALKDVSITGQEGDAMQFVWKDKNHTILGHLSFSGDTLRLETNSRERYRTFEKRLKKVPGVKLQNKTEKTVAELSKERSAERVEDDAVDRIVVTPEIRSMVHKHMREHYANWTDEKLPALGGRTANEMVRTPQGREQVTLLLAEMEGNYRNLPQDNPLHGFSLQFIADKLGLQLPKSYWD